MQIERRMHTALVKLLQKGRMIRKQLFVPCVARPAVGAPVGFIVQSLFADAEIPVDLNMMPVHVDDGDRDGDTIIRKIIHEIEIFLLGIGPVAAPPVAQRPAGKNRRGAAEPV